MRAGRNWATVQKRLTGTKPGSLHFPAARPRKEAGAREVPMEKYSLLIMVLGFVTIGAAVTLL